MGTGTGSGGDGEPFDLETATLKDLYEVVRDENSASYNSFLTKLHRLAQGNPRTLAALRRRLGVPEPTKAAAQRPMRRRPSRPPRDDRRRDAPRPSGWGSLTSELHSSSSPITDFFWERSPDVTPLVQELRASTVGRPTLLPAERSEESIAAERQVERRSRAKLLGRSLAAVDQPPLRSDKPPWQLIGVAIDYRLRYYFGVTPSGQLLAARGAAFIRRNQEALVAALRARGTRGRFAAGPVVTLSGLVDGFFAGLDEILAGANPVGRRLGALDEDALSRHCYVLALLEAFYRAGGAFNSPLYDLMSTARWEPPRQPNVSDMLALADPAWVADLRQLSWAFYDRHAALLPQPATLNPHFAGSADIAADADLIVDGCLIEIKTLKGHTLARRDIYQLIGYALLDYEDDLGITALGFYLTRQAVLVRWPLPALLDSLTAGSSTLAELRSDFRKLLSGA